MSLELGRTRILEKPGFRSSCHWVSQARFSRRLAWAFGRTQTSFALRRTKLWARLHWAVSRPSTHSHPIACSKLVHEPEHACPLLTGPGPARPPKSLTFIDMPRAGLAHLNPSLLLTGPGPQTPHFYWPDPSLLSARPGGVTPALPQPALLSRPCDITKLDYDYDYGS